MTAPRLSRGSRSRFFLYIACLLCLFGLMAIYHNTLTQLDAVKKSNDICQQHQDSLTAQLQVIFDYKNRLEKSLQSEKSEHKQTRTELQKRVEHEKSNCDKNTMEANMRYTSLQQQYKLLLSNHEDLKKETSQAQEEKLSEINALQSKISEMQEQLKQRDHAFEKLKSQNILLQTDKEKLLDTQHQNASEMQRLLQANIVLQKDYERLKIRCDKNNYNGDHETQDVSNSFYMPALKQSNRSFKYEVEDGGGIYKMIANNNENKNLIKGQSEHVGDEPSAADNIDVVPVPPKPDLNNNNHPAPQPGADESSRVLPQPNIIRKSSTTTTTTPRNGEKLAIQPLVQPTSTLKKPTRETNVQNMNNMDNVLAAPNIGDDNKVKKQLPPGVVPVPPQQIASEKETDTNKKEEDSAIEPNRYRNSIIESRAADLEDPSNNNNLQKPLRKPNINEQVADVNQENDAMEVLDSPNNKNGQEDLFNALENRKEGIVNNLQDGDENVRQAPIQSKHINQLGKNQIPRQMPGGLRVAPGIHYDAAEGGDYDNKDEKGGDLRLEEAEPEGEEDGKVL